jgi:hypothetical protein
VADPVDAIVVEDGLKDGPFAPGHLGRPRVVLLSVNVAAAHAKNEGISGDLGVDAKDAMSDDPDLDVRVQVEEKPQVWREARATEESAGMGVVLVLVQLVPEACAKEVS